MTLETLNSLKTQRIIESNVVFGQIVLGTQTIFSKFLREECTFIHPTTMCRLGAECTKGDSCTFIHLSDLKKVETSKSEKSASLNPTTNTMVACKFGINCLKPDCTFGHPSVPSNALNQSLTKVGILCKFDPGCLKSSCPFSHASKTLLANNITPTISSNIQCKYDPFCTRFGCTFKHSPKDSLGISKKFSMSEESLSSPIIITSPNGSNIPVNYTQGRPGTFKNKSLILKSPHISDRGFAVSESETNQFKMDLE